MTESPLEVQRKTGPQPPLDARGLPPGYPWQADWEITPRQVRAMLDDGRDLVLIDCRTPREHAVARIDGAELVPLQDFAARLPQLEAHAERPVVIFCHHGRRSLQAAALLRQQGFEDVRSMAGGIELWSRDIDPTVPRY